MKKLNKKAIEIFSLIMFFVFFLPGVFIMIGGHTSKKSEISLDFIGETQIVMKQAYEDAERQLFFNDQLAKYALYNAVYTLASRGGYEDACSKYQDYCILDPINNPPDYEENFRKLFTGNFNNNFKNYFKKETGYVIGIYDDLVVGIAQNIINITRGTKGGSVTYTIKPHFEARLDYNFTDYDVIIENAKALINDCKDKQDDVQLKACITQKIDSQKFLENNLKWKLGGCGQENIPIQKRNAAFCIITGKKVYTYTGFKDLLYKIAVFFPAPPPPLPPPEQPQQETPPATT